MPHINLTAISRETLQRKSCVIINKKQIQNKNLLLYANIKRLTTENTTCLQYKLTLEIKYKMKYKVNSFATFCENFRLRWMKYRLKMLTSVCPCKLSLCYELLQALEKTTDVAHSKQTILCKAPVLTAKLIY